MSEQSDETGFKRPNSQIISMNIKAMGREFEKKKREGMSE